MKDICANIVKSFLLYQNPLYAFSFPISLIVAILVYGVCVAMKCSSNSYVLQLMIPIITIIIVNIAIHYIACAMMDKEEYERLSHICDSYIQPSSHANRVQRETFENEKVSHSETLRSPLPLIDGLYHDTVEVINQDSTPYMLPYPQSTENFCMVH